MRQAWLIPILLFLCSSLFGQHTLIPFQQGTQYGFADTNGQLVIQPQFEEVTFFVDGVAKACEGGKCGLINTKGGWVIHPQYDQLFVGQSEQDFVIVRHAETQLMGVYRKSGERILDEKFKSIGIRQTISKLLDRVYPLGEGVNTFNIQYLQVSKGMGTTGLMDFNGNLIIPHLYLSIDVLVAGFIQGILPGGVADLYNKAGKKILPQPVKNIWILPTIERIMYIHENQYILADWKGKTMAEFSTAAYRPFQLVGPYLQLTAGPNFNGRKTGGQLLIKADGKALKGDEASTLVQQFGEGGFLIKDNQRSGILTEDGSWILPPKQGKQIDAFGNALSVKDELGTHVHDREGNRISAVAYTQVDPVKRPLYQGWLQAYRPDGSFDLYEDDRRVNYFSGIQHLPEKQQWIHSGKFAVKKGGRWGVMDTLGKVLLPLEYDSIVNQNAEHQLFAQKDNKWGLIDLRGRELVAPAYTSIKRYRSPYFLAEEESTTHLIDTTGTVIASFAKEYIPNSIEGAFIIMHRPKGDGKEYLVIHRDGKQYGPFAEWPGRVVGGGLMNLANKQFTDMYQTPYLDQPVIEAFPYKETEVLLNVGTATAPKRGLYDLTQRKWIIPPKYIRLELADNDLFVAGLESNTVGIMNKHQEWVVPNRYQDFYPLGQVNGMIPFSTGRNAWGLMDFQGNVVVPAEYTNPGASFNSRYEEDEPLFHWQNNEQSIIINETGKVVAKLPKVIIGRTKTKEGHWPLIQHPGQYGRLDAKGRVIIPPDYKSIIQHEGPLYFVVKQVGTSSVGYFRHVNGIAFYASGQ